MIRILDFLAALVGLVILSPLILVFTLLGWINLGSPFFIQDRIGRNKRIFKLVKMRSMKKGTPSVGTHMVDTQSMGAYGSMIRRYKIDEVPQLFNVLLGQMSLVGPRPNLPNQAEVIAERDRMNVYQVKPGITGLSQIREIDMSMPVQLAETDAEMIQGLNVWTYIKIILATVSGKGFGDRVVKG